MQTIREMCQDGAYGYEYRVGLVQSRRGLKYMDVSGFAWRGNTGGRHTTRYRLTEDGAAELNRLLDLVEEARENGGVICKNPNCAAESEHWGVCDHCVPWSLSDVPEQMPHSAFVGCGLEI